MSKVVDGPWEPTPDGYRIWSEEAFTIILWAAHNPATRTPQAREVIRLAAAAPDLRDKLAHIVRLLEPAEAQGLLTQEMLTVMARARAALAKAEGEEKP